MPHIHLNEINTGAAAVILIAVTAGHVVVVVCNQISKIVSAVKRMIRKLKKNK
jgi:hypothetical protein